MPEKKDHSEFVRSGFTAQQFVLIIVAFVLGMASASVFNDLVIERGFGPTTVVAAQHSQESR